MSKRIYEHKDNASGQLNAGISAVTTSIALKAGEGANFPQPYSGTATSGGDAETLNSTGIGASGVAVGDHIENVTDGSIAVILAVNTNDITTTPLKGGSGNTWDSSDEWRVNAFVITIVQYEADGVTIAQREKVLIDERSTDTLTAATRGFESSGAKSFDADDYVYQFVIADSLNSLGEVMSILTQFVADNRDEINQRISVDSGEVYAADSAGSDAYAISPTPAPSSLTVGMEFNFKAGAANVGACTLNVSGLGAVAIKRPDGSDPDNNDIIVGQVVKVVYDGTYWQMQSGLANLPPTEFETTEKILTLGKDVAGGKFVSFDSSGEIVPCAPTGTLASGSDTNTQGGSPASDTGHRRIFRLSPTLILGVHLINGGGNDDLQITVLTVDPTDGSISSQDSSLTINLTAAIGIQQWDIDVIDETTAIIVVNDAGTLKGYIISSLDGTPAIGSVQSLGTGVSGAGIGVKVRDTSNAFIVKQTASTGLQTIALGISGDTITPGTTDTFVADASNVLHIRAIERYVGTDFYCVWYKDNTGGTYHAIACEYDDGTDQFDNVGSAIALTTTHCAIGAELRQVSDTCVVACGRESSGGNDVFIWTITRSGTTLTENSSTSPTHTSHAITNTATIEMVSSHHGVVNFGSNSDGRNRMQFFEVSQGSEDTVTMLGSYLDFAANQSHAMCCLLTRKALACIAWKATTFFARPITFEDNLDMHVGVMQADALDGNTETVTFNGYEDGFAGLTAGTKYQIGYSGDVLDESTVNGWPEGARAFSATEAIVID